MKTFFASLLGTLAALLLIVVGTMFAGFVLLASMAALGKEAPSVEDDSVLVLDLNADITDAPQQFNDSALADALLGEQGPSLLQLRTVTRAIDHAAADGRITGLFLTGSLEPTAYGSSFAALTEVRAALDRFKQAGKPVYGYFVDLGPREYYLASAGSDLALDPFGTLGVLGLASQPTFFAGAFERFGVGVQVIRAGKYKSAVEPYIRRDLSPEAREELQVVLNDLWRPLTETISTARGITPAEFQRLINEGKVSEPDAALAAGLVDRLAYRDEILNDLKTLTGEDADARTFRQISLAAYAHAVGTQKPGVSETRGINGSRGGRIAVVYAEGAIVDGEGSIVEVGGDRFSRELRRLRSDPKVRAIVLRVNSPGGSATASEHILRELRLAAEQVPVVVSMGGYAASGGYWISTGSTRIFAEPMTITGSIGVFGALFNVQQLANDLGITWDTVKTADKADLYSIARPKTEAEMAIFQARVDHTYTDFLARVAAARSMTPEAVHEIAQGRVWSGQRAVELGLVDELGGLADAIAYAAKSAGLSDDFTLSEFPRKKDLGEAIAEMLERLQPTGARAGGPLGAMLKRVESEFQAVGQFNDPRHVYARLPLQIVAP